MSPVVLWSYLEQSREVNHYLDFSAEICLLVQDCACDCDCALVWKIPEMQGKAPAENISLFAGAFSVLLKNKSFTLKH